MVELQMVERKKQRASRPAGRSVLPSVANLCSSFPFLLFVIAWELNEYRELNRRFNHMNNYRTNNRIAFSTPFSTKCLSTKWCFFWHFFRPIAFWQNNPARTLYSTLTILQHLAIYLFLELIGMCGNRNIFTAIFFSVHISRKIEKKTMKSYFEKNLSFSFRHLIFLECWADSWVKES